MRDSNPRGYETSFAYAQLARSRSPTGLLAARRDGPHTLACGSSSQQRFAETLVDPASPATSEQSPLCDHVIFCLRHKKPPGASLPCSSSPQKVTLRLRCSLINALTTLRLATNFLRKMASLFKTLHPIREHRHGGGRELFCPRWAFTGELRFCGAKVEFCHVPSPPCPHKRQSPSPSPYKDIFYFS